MVSPSLNAVDYNSTLDNKAIPAQFQILGFKCVFCTVMLKAINSWNGDLVFLILHLDTYFLGLFQTSMASSQLASANIVYI